MANYGPRTTRGRYITTNRPSLSGTSVEGKTEFNRAISGLAELIEDFQPILEQVAERGFYPAMQEIFDTENFGRWPKLTPAYARAKRRRWGDKPIMQASGMLMRSLTKKGAEMNFQIGIGKNQLNIGTNAQSRFAAKRRPVFQFTDKQFGQMATVASEEVVKEARRLGFDASTE